MQSGSEKESIRTDRKVLVSLSKQSREQASTDSDDRASKDRVRDRAGESTSLGPHWG